MKTPFVLGVCGGSGSGKSTLAFGLADTYPDETLVFHVDDYFRPEADVPKLHGMPNWDCPEALYTDKMVNDLRALKQGMPAIINTKSPRLNPGFLKTGKRIPVEFQPRPLIIVEGFMALHLAELRNLFDCSIFLDAPFELHASRRIHGKLHKFPPEYDEFVLRPMHEKYVLPSKKFADVVIQVDQKTAADVLAEAQKLLQRKGWSYNGTYPA